MGRSSRLGGPSTSDGAGVPGVDVTTLVRGESAQARTVVSALTGAPAAGRTALGLGTASTAASTAFLAAPVATGTATLSGGAATVTNANVTANTVVRLCPQTVGGTPGAVFVSARTASTSFVISSTSGTDTSVIYYEVVAW